MHAREGAEGYTMAASGNYDCYICEYLAATKRFETLRAFMQECPDSCKDDDVPDAILLRLRCAEVEVELRKIQDMLDNGRELLLERIDLFKRFITSIDKLRNVSYW